MAEDIESIIRRVVRQELERSRADTAEMNAGKHAYTVQSMSEAYDISVSYLRAEIADRKQRPRHLGRKPLIGIDEAERWFASLPDEKPRI